MRVQDHWHKNFAQAQGISPSDPYFNSGVLLIDLVAWRREKIGELATSLAITHRDSIKYHDQCALNLALAGKFGILSPEWNHHYTPRGLRALIENYGPDIAVHLVYSPKIIHFAGSKKPWLHRSPGYKVREYHNYMKTVNPTFDPHQLPRVPGDRRHAVHRLLDWQVHSLPVHVRKKRVIKIFFALSATLYLNFFFSARSIFRRLKLVVGICSTRTR